MLVNLSALSSHAHLLCVGGTVQYSRPGIVEYFSLAPLPTNAVDMVEVAGIDRSHVLATEYADLETLCLRITRRQRGTSSGQVLEGLVDDTVCTDVLCYGSGVPLMGDKFRSRRKVDSVDVSVGDGRGA